jgi:hypothetical protein
MQPSSELTRTPEGAHEAVALPSPGVRGRPILVTGAHRSGTTWVGKMLALAPGTGYVHEPFSPITDPGISSAPFERFFTAVTPENESRYLPGLRKSFAFDYDWASQLPTVRSPRAAARSVRDAAAFARARRRHARPIVKDPIALLSAEWLEQRFGMDVLVLIRHPAGFAGSLRRLGMSFRFETFLDDEGLMEDRLAPFADELRAQVEAPGDFVERAGLLWRILYTVVDEYRAAHPGWIFVRHEDLSREPVAGFERVYAQLGLDFTPAIAQRIGEHSAPARPVRHPSAHAVRMDSASTVESWRDRLSPDELERLHAAVAEISGRFYADDEW